MVQCVYYILKIALGFITPVRCGSKNHTQLQQNEPNCNFWYRKSPLQSSLYLYATCKTI